MESLRISSAAYFEDRKSLLLCFQGLLSVGSVGSHWGEHPA